MQASGWAQGQSWGFWRSGAALTGQGMCFAGVLGAQDLLSMGGVSLLQMFLLQNQSVVFFLHSHFVVQAGSTFIKLSHLRHHTDQRCP